MPIVTERAKQVLLNMELEPSSRTAYFFSVFPFLLHMCMGSSHSHNIHVCKRTFRTIFATEINPDINPATDLWFQHVFLDP